jgi:hypothetical protein
MSKGTMLFHLEAVQEEVALFRQHAERHPLVWSQFVSFDPVPATPHEVQVDQPVEVATDTEVFAARLEERALLALLVPQPLLDDG